MNRKFTSKGGYSVTHQSQELLLRAVLFQDERALEYWRSWQQQVDEDDLDEGSHRLIPMLYENLSGLGVSARQLKGYKKTYRFYWYRNQLLLSKMLPCIDILIKNGIDYRLLKGVPLAFHYYSGSGLRPFADVDILVPIKDVNAVFDLLSANGFSPSFTQSLEELLESRHSVGFRHKTGLLLDIHWYLTYRRWGDDQVPELWNEAEEFEFGSRKLKTISPTHHLFHTLIHGADWSYISPIRWIPDAVKIIYARNEEIDWEQLTSLAANLRLSFTLHQQLEKLKEFVEFPKLDSEAKEPGNSEENWQRNEHIVLSQPTNLMRKIQGFWYLQKRLNKNGKLLKRVMTFPRFVMRSIELSPNENMIKQMLRKLFNWI